MNALMCAQNNQQLTFPGPSFQSSFPAANSSSLGANLYQQVPQMNPLMSAYNNQQMLGSSPFFPTANFGLVGPSLPAAPVTQPQESEVLKTVRMMCVMSTMNMLR